jgi:hypothetical protein
MWVSENEIDTCLNHITLLKNVVAYGTNVSNFMQPCTCWNLNNRKKDLLEEVVWILASGLWSAM